MMLKNTVHQINSLKSKQTFGYQTCTVPVMSENTQCFYDRRKIKWKNCMLYIEKLSDREYKGMDINTYKPLKGQGCFL
jgi:hypothetical protein